MSTGIFNPAILVLLAIVQVRLLGQTLPAWQEALAQDPKNEDAHFHVASLLLASGKAREAADAANAGLEAIPGSTRLFLLKTEALSAAGECYLSRATLRSEARKSQNLNLHLHLAETEDAFPGSAAIWHDFAERFEKEVADSKELTGILRRGLLAATRDNDRDSMRWFTGRLESQGDRDFVSTYLRPSQTTPSTMVLPGGISALAYPAQTSEGIPAGRFLTEYCRRFGALYAKGESKAEQQYAGGIGEYFSQLAELESLSSKDPGGFTTTVSLKDKAHRQQTARILALLGVRVRDAHGEVDLEEDTKGPGKELLAAALGVDHIALLKALRAGEDFVLTVRNDPVDIWPGEEFWRNNFYPNERPYGGFAEALPRSPRMGKLYVALSVLDRKMIEALLKAFDAKTLYEKYTDVLGQYSASLAIENDKIVVPGGDHASSTWGLLAGADPADPPAFVKALLTKDDGRLFSFFFILSELDAPHQRFCTLSPFRAKLLYQLFKESAEAQRVRHAVVKPAMSEFLRCIPLDREGRVRFPGTPGVWVEAADNAPPQRRPLSPPEEDDILTKLVRTGHRGQRTTLDAFTAVSRIDAHREVPLDPDSAQVLKRQYRKWLSEFPYFTTLTTLGATDYRRFFAVLDKLNPASVGDNGIAGEFHGLIELVCLLLRRGELTEQDASKIFGAICERFGDAASPAEYAAAAADTLTQLTRNTDESVDQRIRTALFGRSRQLPSGYGDGARSFDPLDTRRRDFERVLDLQSAPRLTPILEVAAIAKGILTQAPSQETLDALDKAVGAVPSATFSTEGRNASSLKERENLDQYDVEPLRKAAANVRREAAKHKAAGKDFEKASQELLAALNPQFTLALSGIVYAWYLRADDLPVSDDALLLRKHRYLDLIGTNGRGVTSAFFRESTGAGSYFAGGFAAFGYTAGSAAAPGLINGSGVEQEFIAAQISTVRDTNWAGLSESDLRLFALRVLAAREWVVAAAAQQSVLAALKQTTIGLLSPARRTALLNALDERSWPEVWAAVTLSDLYSLGTLYLETFPSDAWASSTVAALRRLASQNSGKNLDLLGAVPTALNGCSHPHLILKAPYEEYARHVLPVDLAERVSEFKLQLAFTADQAGIPPAILAAVAESLTEEALQRARMAGTYDWRSLVNAWADIDSGLLLKRLDAR